MEVGKWTASERVVQMKPSKRRQLSGQESLSKMTECFLHFTDNPKENIAHLIQFCGEALGADSAVYERMDGVKLTRLGMWNLKEEMVNAFSSFQEVSRSNNVKMGHGDIFEIRDLKESGDPDGRACTYYGRIVKYHGIPVGALCVIYLGDPQLSEEGREALAITAAALAIEDKRLRALEIIEEQQMKMIGAAKMSALGDMAAGIAHEINNPLFAILMRVEHMREMLNPRTDDGSGIRPEMLRMVNIIESLGGRISRIVKNLREFSGDTQDEPFQEVSVKEVLERSLEFCGERLKQRKVELKVELSNPQMRIRCRPTEISRVILNLLTNAYDAIEDQKENWIHVVVQEQSGVVTISVTDSGHGISKEIQHKIFDPFFTTKEVNRGKGLGLSISKGIVDQHHGTLLLDPQCQNTRFVLTLPKTQVNRNIAKVTFS